MGIVVALFTLVAGRLQKPQVNLKKVARDITVLTRELRNSARLKNSTYRIVFEIDPDKSAYFVEAAPGAVLIPTEEQIKKQTEKIGDGDVIESPFVQQKSTIKDKRELPNGLKFISLESMGRPEATRSGKAYLHLTPDGMVERVALQIGTKKDQVWTLLFNSLSGQVDIVEKPMTLKELSQ
jgi:general secretion pathway protein H